MNYKISIEIPESIILNEIYNVPDDGIEVKDNTIFFTKFDVNGYLGLVFETKKTDNPELLLTFNCNIISENGNIQKIEKHILLFRPSIELIDAPKKMNVGLNNNEFFVDNQITIQNKGEGTAIVQLSINDKSDFKKETPEEMELFISKFLIDFVDGLELLKKDYPAHSDFLKRLVNFINIRDEFNEEYLEEKKYIEKHAENIFQNEHEFAESYISNLMQAYLKNIYIITPFESFASYLKSIETGNIILKDSVDVLTITKAEGTIKPKLEITDLISNAYEPIELNEVEIEVKDDVQFPIQIPVYRLFKWK